MVYTRSKTSVSEAEAEPEAVGGQVEMPGKSADISASDLVLHFMDLLNEDNVLRKMKAVLYPNELASKIDNMQATINSMAKQLQEKDNKITLLQAKVSNLEDELDTQQQYTRRPNLRIYGIREPTENDDTDAEVLSLVNGTLKLSPPIRLQDIERSHRVGRRVSAALLERDVPPHQPAHENRGESDGTTESPDGGNIYSETCLRQPPL